MRCANCGRSVPDAQLVYSWGMSLCYPCYQRGMASSRRVLVLVPLIFLALVAVLVGLMVWCFPEVTRM